MSDDDFSGSPDNPAETIVKASVPAPAPKSAAEQAWEEKLIDEAQARIARRTYLFWSVLVAAGLIFITFLIYIVWVHLCPDRKVDHLLVWLLGALPLGLVFVLIKVTADPRKDEPVTTWPDELIKVGNNLVDVVADIVKKKLG